ncbi:BspA family leucine-rich repeat surface protein [Ruminococcus albus]|uniref:BspA family leucine-rich repeat surface protein n=1 Tax=Ruminococcus albus TaxID=1264 RepID=UPI000467129B|nr:BspA family leucine-rich repeat surface protein [Ruminococcus albus]
MKMKKVLAVLMSLCMTAGVVSYGAPVITQTITAQAEAAAEAECYSFDEETGVLTLSGTVDRGALIEILKTSRDKVISIVAEKGTVFPENSSELFWGFSCCTSIDLSNADTSNVTDMSSMFERCYKVKTIDLSGFDTSNVTDMSSMFYECLELTSLDLSGFDTSKVTSFDSMFDACHKLSKLDISGFDTSNVTDMSSMFSGCLELTSFDLSGFDTSKVTNFKWMFNNCRKMSTFDISGFDTGKVTDMSGMFENCFALTELDLSNFDTSNVINMSSMFSDCSDLTELDLSSFDTSRASDESDPKASIIDMFEDCSTLQFLTLGEKFTEITEEMRLINSYTGWANADDPANLVSDDGEYAVIENNGKNIYVRRLTYLHYLKYPINIKLEYSEEYNQVRFTWDKVKRADKYGIAVYLAGKWKVQTQNITDTTYTTPKNLTPGITYKVAIAARVNGKWDTENAIKNYVICKIGGNNSYIKPSREVPFGADLYVIADEINMYRGPGKRYGKVTTIPKNSYLQELGVIGNNNNWVFTLYRGQYGWVQVENEYGDKQIEIPRYLYPVVAKPVIYLYPEKETDVHVEVELTEADLATTYPKYNNGWDVVAKPDGSLVNKVDGSHHRYLFWDAVNCRTEFDFSKGFCVAGSDTESFLKEKLSYMGLTEDEMNEFIVYWLPLMEHNKYNLISFQSEKYTDSAKLNITPAPDSMLRVFMTYVPLEEAVDIEPQELSTFERNGFTVVEWGGSEIKYKR